MNFEWMAWTVPTSIFFSTIAVILVSMTVWQIVAPGGKRQGFLPIATTRGDRLFIGLLSSAYIHLAWLGLTDWNLWIALIISIVWCIFLMKFG